MIVNNQRVVIIKTKEELMPQLIENQPINPDHTQLLTKGIQMQASMMNLKTNLLMPTWVIHSKTAPNQKILRTPTTITLPRLAKILRLNQAKNSNFSKMPKTFPSLNPKRRLCSSSKTQPNLMLTPPLSLALTSTNQVTTRKITTFWSKIWFKTKITPNRSLLRLRTRTSISNPTNLPATGKSTTLKMLCTIITKVIH